MTPAEIIFHRRVAVLEHAQKTGNVPRPVGLRHLPHPLLPVEERGRPPRPRSTRPEGTSNTADAGRHAHSCGPGPVDPGRDRAHHRLSPVCGPPRRPGFTIAKSTVQKHLVAHGLGRRSQRLARAAAITASTTGLVTEAAADEDRFGFCLATGGPGELVCLDSFYIGKLKGVGKVYQLTAIDVFTRWAITTIVLGPVTHAHTMRFVDQLLRSWRKHGVRVKAVLTDYGPEYVAAGFQATWRPRGSATSGSRPGRPTTTPSASGSTRPSSQSAGVLPSTEALHLDPPASSRSRRLARDLQQPPAEPRRLHAG